MCFDRSKKHRGTNTYPLTQKCVREIKNINRKQRFTQDLNKDGHDKDVYKAVLVVA